MVIAVLVVCGDAAQGVFRMEDLMESVVGWDVVQVHLVFTASIVVHLPALKEGT